jgi:hypothetical protein
MRSASSLVFVIADARKNPPIINQITLLENVLRYTFTSCGDDVNNSEPSVKARYARINNPTANGGMASVSHRPTEKQRRNRTYVCACEKDGSITAQVSPRAAMSEIRNLPVCLNLFI